MIVHARIGRKLRISETYVRLMTQQRKNLQKLLSGEADQSFRFDELFSLLRSLRFELRRRTGSHHIFVRADLPEIINLQPRKSGDAKPYQVRQVRAIILKYRLHVSLFQGAEDDDFDT